MFFSPTRELTVSPVGEGVAVAEGVGSSPLHAASASANVSSVAARRRWARLPISMAKC
jgi:hypothetical protein